MAHSQHTRAHEHTHTPLHMCLTTVHKLFECPESNQHYVYFSNQYGGPSLCCCQCWFSTVTQKSLALLFIYIYFQNKLRSDNYLVFGFLAHVNRAKNKTILNLFLISWSKDLLNTNFTVECCLFILCAEIAEISTSVTDKGICWSGTTNLVFANKLCALNNNIVNLIRKWIACFDGKTSFDVDCWTIEARKGF